MKQKPIIHGRDHLKGGADPIPGIGCCPPHTTCTAFPDMVSEIAAAHPGGLRGYWRLGDGLAPYADSSGFSAGDPAAAAFHTAGGGGTYSPMTLDYTPGALPAPDDDGAVAFNAPGDSSTVVRGDYLQAAWAGGDTDRFAFTGVTPFTVACWIKPFASATNWVGPIINTIAVAGGIGGIDSGWRLDMTWPSRVIGFTRAPNVSSGGSYDSAVSPSGPTAGEWHLIAGVYDGTNLHLYVDGALAATHASTGTYGPTYFGTTPQFATGALSHGVGQGYFYGGLDEITIWGVALTAGEIADLHTAGLPCSPTAEGMVITSDGSGATEWAYPTIAVDDPALRLPAGRYDTIHLGVNLTGTDMGDGSITVDASGGGSGGPAADTQVWMPLFDTDGGVVLDSDEGLIPTLIPIA